MNNRGVDVQVLKMRLFIADDHIYIVLAPQAVIGDGQQRVDVWR